MVSYKADRFVYNVDADSSALNERAIETLRKVPTIMVNRKGEISSDFDKNIIFKLNGLNDPLLASPQDILNALPSRSVRKFEVITHPGLQYGENAIIVNVSTKGRLEGFLMTATSKATDQKWSNTLFALTKINRFRISGAYAHHWTWGHSSRFSSEESRLNSVTSYQTFYNSKSGGNKSHDNNYELSASYDVDDKSIITAFGRLFLRNNMHSTSTGNTSVFQNDGTKYYSYLRNSTNNLKSPEYEASLSYERIFGEEGIDGKFFAGYSYYGRPYDEHKYKTYSEIDSVMGFSNTVGDLRDYLNENSSAENWHTVEMEYNHRFARKHLIMLDVKSLMRFDYDNTEDYYSAVGKNRYALDEQTTSHYKRTQTLLNSTLGYTYKHKNFMATLGIRPELDHEKMEQRDYTYHKTFVDIPYGVTLSHSFSDRVSLAANYAKSVSRPSVSALDPHKDQTVLNELTYGNMDLKPQRNHTFSLSSNFRIGKYDAYYIGLELSHVYSNRLILDYSFLDGNILNKTKANIGCKHQTKLQISARKRYGRLFLRIVPSLEYLTFDAEKIGQSNNGFFFRVRGSGEYELPKDFYLDFEGSFNTDYVMLQGKGGKSFYYDLSLTKNFLKNKLRLTASASSFVPIHYTEKGYTEAANYFYSYSSRYFNASFYFSVSYTLGKLKARVKSTEKKIENDDIKTDYSE